MFNDDGKQMQLYTYAAKEPLIRNYGFDMLNNDWHSMQLYTGAAK